VITDKNLTKQQACEREYELIKELNPRFNKPYGVPCVLVGDKLNEAKKLREEGLYYSQIAEALNVSTMTVWRALNG
jgi:DNA invertase Pin-like site-specific DNA recombinase